MSIDYKERAEMYRRQLGGTNAALNRSRQRERDLEAFIRDLWSDYEWATGDLEDTDYTKAGLYERMRKLGVKA